MCVIISRPKGVSLDRQIYLNCWTNEDDGAGFAYINRESKTLEVRKGLMTFEAFWEALQEIDGQETIIHFRNASPGMVINAENTHPFEYDTSRIEHFTFRDPGTDEVLPKYQFAFTHNGKLAWRDTPKESDTNCFINDLLGPHMARDPYFLDPRDEPNPPTPTGQIMLEKLIGDFNKFAIMRYDLENDESRVYIVNKKAGKEYQGCWFSKESYLTIRQEYRRPAHHRYDMDDWPDHHRSWLPARETGAEFQLRLQAVRDASDRQIAAITNGPAIQLPGPKSGTGVSNPTPTATVLPDQYETYSMVDERGWRWDFDHHCWIHPASSNTTACLAHRVSRPPYWEQHLITLREDSIKSQRAEVHQSMKGLTEIERKVIIREARAWYYRTVKMQTSDNQLHNVILRLRNKVRELHPSMKTDMDAYNWVLTINRTGKDVYFQLMYKAGEVDSKGVVTEKGAAAGGVSLPVVPAVDATIPVEIVVVPDAVPTDPSTEVPE